MNQSDIDALTGGGAAGQRAPDLAELGAGVAGTAEVPLAMLMDLTLPLSIELGRTRMTVQDILRLGRGSVVQLERTVGEPVDIYVGDRRLAQGEIVVVNDYLGVRITQVVAAAGAEAAA